MASAPRLATYNIPSLAFKLLDPSRPSLCPRAGTISLEPVQNVASGNLTVETPGFMTMTSRGAVPHLTWDHLDKTSVVTMIHAPFESFLEQQPPIPTIFPSDRPLHSFLNYSPSRYILSTSLRDWNDDKDITANGKDSVSALCVRGVRSVTPADWNAHVSAMRPDIVFALPDIPFTATPPSEKRTMKTLERSLRWLGQILRISHPNVFVHMAGGHNDVARDDFATGLLEPLEGPEARDLQPLGLDKLDDGVAGYSFDMAPLRKQVPSLDASQASLTDLVSISLKPLPDSKPRLVSGCTSPHEILSLVNVGIDLFDTFFAQRAANWGIALDFAFPAPAQDGASPIEIGVNLYEPDYERQFTRLSTNFSGFFESHPDRPVCPCIACSPSFSTTPVVHSSIDERLPSQNATVYEPAVTRAYVHHLLHTHEMSAHTYLAAHNINVLSSFFVSIRKFIQRPDLQESFATELTRFEAHYTRPDIPNGLFDRANVQFRDVDLVRGKGRLAREKVAKANVVDPSPGLVIQLET